MTPLDWANRDLYEYARDRDRLIWFTRALRAHRDALLAGRDGKDTAMEIVRRVDVLRATEATHKSVTDPEKQR